MYSSTCFKEPRKCHFLQKWINAKYALFTAFDFTRTRFRLSVEFYDWLLCIQISVTLMDVLIYTIRYYRLYMSGCSDHCPPSSAPDLSVGMISIPADLAWKITVEWRAGEFVCKLVKFLQVGSHPATHTHTHTQPVSQSQF